MDAIFGRSHLSACIQVHLGEGDCPSTMNLWNFVRSGLFAINHFLRYEMSSCSCYSNKWQ